MALNCWVVPLAMEGEGGVTAMDTRVAEVTVKVVELVTAPRVAVMAVVPGLMPVANP